jgi:hypothetical protein
VSGEVTPAVTGSRERERRGISGRREKVTWPGSGVHSSAREREDGWVPFRVDFLGRGSLAGLGRMASPGGPFLFLFFFLLFFFCFLVFFIDLAFVTQMTSNQLQKFSEISSNNP